MFHPSLASAYEPQQRHFGRAIRACFTLAGCYWIVIYAMQWLGMIDHDQLRELRAGQTMIYFILLSLWGVEYLRESRRLKRVIARSEELGVAVSRISTDDLSPSLGTFAILHPIAPSSMSAWIFPILNIAGLVVAAILIAQRYVAAFSAAW